METQVILQSCKQAGLSYKYSSFWDMSCPACLLTLGPKKWDLANASCLGGGGCCGMQLGFGQ